MGIPAQPSRRTLAPLPMAATTDGGGVSNQPGYQPVTNPSVRLGTSTQRLPDALLGQQWVFVNLEAAAFENA